MSALGQNRTSDGLLGYVCFTPESGHTRAVLGIPLCARSGLKRPQLAVNNSRRYTSIDGACCHSPTMIRKAILSEIPRLIEIRGAVRENRLSDPSRVTLADYTWHITHAPIYVWEDAGLIKGMSAGDPRNGSIWALFVDHAFEGQGIGQALILAACTSLGAAGHRIAKLSTEPGREQSGSICAMGGLPKGTRRGARLSL